MKLTKLNPLFAAVTAILCLGVGSASAAVITVSYAGVVFNINQQLPSYVQGFNSGYIPMSGTSVTGSGSFMTPDGSSNTDRTLTGSYSGAGTNSLSISSVWSSTTEFNNTPVYTQVDGSYNVYVGITVDTTGVYTFGGGLSAFSNTVTTSGSGSYAIYGLGGEATIKNNDTGNYVGGSGNLGGYPQQATPTTPGTFSTQVTLTAGVNYAFDITNYMYSGFAGSGVNSNSTGWDVTITGPAAPVPEVSSALLGALGVIGFGLRRRR